MLRENDVARQVALRQPELCDLSQSDVSELMKLQLEKFHSKEVAALAAVDEANNVLRMGIVEAQHTLMSAPAFVEPTDPASRARWPQMTSSERADFV